MPPLRWIKRLFALVNLLLLLLLAGVTARRLPISASQVVLPVVGGETSEATPTPYVSGPTPTPLPPTPTSAATATPLRPSPTATPVPGAQPRSTAAPGPTGTPVPGAALVRPSPTGAPLPMTPTPEGTVYVVAEGDSIWGIARKFNTTVNTVAKANNLSVDAPLRIGQKLVIPSGQ